MKLKRVYYKKSYNIFIANIYIANNKIQLTYQFILRLNLHYQH